LQGRLRYLGSIISVWPAEVITRQLSGICWGREIAWEVLCNSGVGWAGGGVRCVEDAEKSKVNLSLFTP
jgi:hypothetical protein